MTAFVSDNFTYTADTNLTSFGWGAHRGSIFSDATGTKATPALTSSSEYYLPTVTPPSADYAVRADITFDGTESSGSILGVIARSSSYEATYYLAFVVWGSVSGQFVIRRMRAGSATALVTVGAGTVYNTTGTKTAELHVVTNGAQVELEFWWDGALVASAIDTHADRITDAGYPGIGKNAATRYGSFWDNFEAEVIGGASPPIAPTIDTTTSITQTGATVNWTDNSADETGFKVEYSASPYSSWTTATTTAADATSYALTGLTPGVTYKARVASTNANGDSAWVETAEFTTAAAVVKGVRIQLYDGAAAQASLTGLTVAWFDDDPATFGAPVLQSATETTDASGWLEVDLDGYTALGVSDPGFLIVYKAGATAADDIVFAGRLVIEDIG